MTMMTPMKRKTMASPRPRRAWLIGAAAEKEPARTGAALEGAAERRARLDAVGEVEEVGGEVGAGLDEDGAGEGEEEEAGAEVLGGGDGCADEHGHDGGGVGEGAQRQPPGASGREGRRGGGRPPSPLSRRRCA